jgi:hypothetical protein
MPAGRPAHDGVVGDFTLYILARRNRIRQLLQRLFPEFFLQMLCFIDEGTPV